MYRSAIEKLKAWKDAKNRKPLVIYGARQVGKTWLMREFGARHYDAVAYISLESDRVFRSIFEGDFNIPRIIGDLSLASGVKITPRTLLILDEVQECPRALTSLKYFCEEAPEYPVMAAGSLLGVMSLEGTGFPVGKVDMLTLHPMSFYEFLGAVDARLLPSLRAFDFPTIATFHEGLVESLRRYLFVGGMPAAVGRYADTSDFGEVRAVQRQIIDSYYADFAKHIPSDCIARTRELWDSVPAQLAKENKRFLYSDMKKGSRGRAYEAALNWLTQTNLIRRLHRVSLPNIPLAGYRQANIFKIYMTDIGLLSARIGVDPRLYLDGDAAFSHYKGGLAEQFVLQELIAADDTLPVFYWATDKNTAEIEFVLQCEDVVPVEVKSGTHVASESLRAYRDKFRPARAVRASLKKFGLADGLCSVPLYMMGDIQRLLKVLRF